MIPWAIADTGPLVACLDRRDEYHAWAVERIRGLRPPLLICEPVLTETLHLLAGLPTAGEEIFALLEKGALRIEFSLAGHVAEVRALCDKYRDRPMSLADACLVRMAELHDRHAVFTLDDDFKVYRKNGREPLNLISPL